jgi:hypothetical protein
MGCRANVVTRYVCEYDGSSVFNWAADEVLAMLENNDIIVWQDNEGDNYNDWRINCHGESGENFQKYVTHLGTLPPGETNEYFKGNADHADYTNEFVKRILEEWWEARDEKDQVIRVHWF